MIIMKTPASQTLQLPPLCVCVCVCVCPTRGQMIDDAHIFSRSEKKCKKRSVQRREFRIKKPKKKMIMKRGSGSGRVKANEQIDSVAQLQWGDGVTSVAVPFLCVCGRRCPIQKEEELIIEQIDLCWAFHHPFNSVAMSQSTAELLSSQSSVRRYGVAAPFDSTTTSQLNYQKPIGC